MKKKEKRVLFLRILLGILIVCNMAVIFLFSSQNGAKSAAVSKQVVISIVEMISKWAEKKVATSETTPEETAVPPIQESGVTEPEELPTTTPEDIGGIVTAPPEEITTPDIPEGTTKPKETTTLAETTTHEEITTPEETTTADPMEHLTEEQKMMVNKAHTPIRKLAHMLEFGSLAALALLLLVTWPGKLLWRYAASLGFTLFYAATDEMHQLFSQDRGARLSDVAIDFAGAFITCTLLLIFIAAVRHNRRLVTTRYDLPYVPNNKPLSLALVADLHACPHEKLVERLRDASPDVILLAGDIMENFELKDEGSSGYSFLRSCAAIAPTYYSFGNHETVGANKKGEHCVLDVPTEIRERIANTGVTLLHNESVLWNGIRICGLTSGLSKTENRPNEAALAEFAAFPEFRILLCHHPEYYEPYIRKTNIELTVSGHAHGGQWRLFGRGVYAPGQGIFPKYTAGVIDNRFVISRGAGDQTRVPRFANPRELVIIRCIEKNKTESLNQEKEK